MVLQATIAQCLEDAIFLEGDKEKRALAEARAEINENLMEQKRRFGQRVEYGQVIQLWSVLLIFVVSLDGWILDRIVKMEHIGCVLFIYMTPSHQPSHRFPCVRRLSLLHAFVPIQ
jgi:hypothetical protein